MRKKIKWIQCLLIGSIALNVLVFSQIANTRQIIQQDVRNLQWKIDGVNNEIRSFNLQLNQMQQEKSWIIRESLTPNPKASTPEGIQLDLEWSFRELERGTGVSVLFRNRTQDDWKEVEATKLADNLFRASLLVTEGNLYEYQIMTKGTTTQVGDIKVVPTHFYRRPVPIMIRHNIAHQDRRGNFNYLSMHVLNPHQTPFPFFEVVRMEVILYEGDQFKDAIPLEPLADHHREEHFRMEVRGENLSYDITTAYFEVEYRDGIILREEIYPENRYLEEHEQEW